MRFKVWAKRVLLGLAGLLTSFALLVGLGWWYYHPAFTRTHGIVYGKRRGRDLILDVVKPTSPNGLGVILAVSGGWKSGTNSFHPWMVAPLLRRGYTVFPVCHISQPDSTVPEIAADMQRAVRFIRHHATEYSIDPRRLGMTGGSAGGHLSLVLATLGGPGPQDATDPVDRESSAVQAVAVFYPVTDLIDLHGSTTDTGGNLPPKGYEAAFGSVTDREVWRAMGLSLSPIAHVTTNLPPILIYHGDADTLVPLNQSQRFQVRAQELHRTVEVVVHPGGTHGWPSMIWDIRQFANWFDRYLRSADAN
jgi:acetyl esterase/lipase